MKTQIRKKLISLLLIIQISIFEAKTNSKSIKEYKKENYDDYYYDEYDDYEDYHKSKIGKYALIGGAIIAGTAFLPGLLGFTATGIAGGSIASIVQASIGNVASGSIFAWLTSIAMKGLLYKSAAVGVIVAGAGGVSEYLKLEKSEDKLAKLIRTVINNRDNGKIILAIFANKSRNKIIRILIQYEKRYHRDPINDILRYLSGSDLTMFKKLIRELRL